LLYLLEAHDPVWFVLHLNIQNLRGIIWITHCRTAHCSIC